MKHSPDKEKVHKITTEAVDSQRGRAHFQTQLTDLWLKNDFISNTEVEWLKKEIYTHSERLLWRLHLHLILYMEKAFKCFDYCLPGTAKTKNPVTWSILEAGMVFVFSFVISFRNLGNLSEATPPETGHLCKTLRACHMQSSGLQESWVWLSKRLQPLKGEKTCTKLPPLPHQIKVSIHRNKYCVIKW